MLIWNWNWLFARDVLRIHDYGTHIGHLSHDDAKFCRVRTPLTGMKVTREGWPSYKEKCEFSLLLLISAWFWQHLNFKAYHPCPFPHSIALCRRYLEFVCKGQDDKVSRFLSHCVAVVWITFNIKILQADVSVIWFASLVNIRDRRH